MLRRLLQKFKRVDNNQNKKEEKKKIIKEYLLKIGLSWSDIENVLFWKDPRISLAVFIILTGLFWKFISYKLQRLGLIIIAAAVPCSFPETRTYIAQYSCEKFQLNLKPERRSLGFNDNDVYDFLVDYWIAIEENYIYMVDLKNKSPVKFCLMVLASLTLLLMVTKCLPLAGLIYFSGAIFYFYPILNYLDLFNILTCNMEKLARPFIMHWTYSQTKRRRNRNLNTIKTYNNHAASLSDLETEEFIPSLNKDSKAKFSHTMTERKFSSDDEFQLRGDFVREAEEFSSDNVEQSFLSSFSYQVPDEMPSLSNFDSIMEPVDDDFQRGLDFRNITLASNNTSNFGLPNYDDEDVTSEDIDDIPFEDEGHRKFSKEDRFTEPTDEDVHEQSKLLRDVYDCSGSDNDSEIFDVDQEFEFLDRTELYNVTDEEINEQNVGGHSHSENVNSNSNILGY